MYHVGWRTEENSYDILEVHPLLWPNFYFGWGKLAGPTIKHPFFFCLSPPLQFLSVLAKYFILGGEVSVSTCGRPVLPVWLVTLIQHKDPLWKHKDKQWRGHNYLIVLTFFCLIAQTKRFEKERGKENDNLLHQLNYSVLLGFFTFSRSALKYEI